MDKRIIIKHDALEPCPLCGRKDRITGWLWGRKATLKIFQRYMLSCDRCGFDGYVRMGFRRAGRAWNKSAKIRAGMSKGV